MNNIGLIISGNLTGFSRFYASPNANDIYNEAKFDFDYRNFLTFLNNDDKAYAISFAPTVISVSLVTRILDSFRRPGVLVVSILLPRNKKVESAMNSQNNKALYQLLNAVHDTFREKNFVNGMVNQNAAVLIQDYYTDILSNFALVPDGLQRPINSRIEVSSPNKRLGYVKSTEDNVPLYLSSLCRKNYEGYHHVFFAENAPQNIDEEPVEVVFYNVVVTNEKRRIPSVKLTDMIPNVRPGEGEIDIANKNLTYQQVLNGEAGRNIVASMVGETIEITYRFGKETKEVHFIFTDGSNVIPFASVCPKIVYADRTVNVGSEIWTFEGKEIYERKTIESGSVNFTIKRESTNLDIRRQKNGSECLIHVEQNSRIEINFPAPFNKLKQITFRRKNGESKEFDVEGYLNEVLPGKLEEYTYVIESNYYETATGQLPPLGVKVTINLRAKADNHSTPNARTTSTIHRADSNPPRTKTTIRGANGGSLKFDGENTVTTNKPTKKKNNKTVLWGSVAASSVLLVLLLVFFWPNLSKPKRGEETPDLVASNDSVDRKIILNFIGADNKPIEDMSNYGFTYEVFSEYVNIYVSPENFVDRIDSVTTGKYQLTYNVNGRTSEIGELRFTISVDGITITADDAKKVISAEELEDSINFDGVVDIKLNVKASEISLYNEFDHIDIDKLTQFQIGKYQERVDEIKKRNKGSQLAEQLQKKLDILKDKFGSSSDDSGKKTDQQRQQRQQQQQQQQQSDSKQSDIIKDYPMIQDMISRFEQVESKQQKGLTDRQKNIISNYNNYVIKVQKSSIQEDEKNTLKQQLKICKTFSSLQNFMLNYSRSI